MAARRAQLHGVNMQLRRNIGILRDDVNDFKGFFIHARGWSEFDRVMSQLRGLCPGGTVRDLADALSAMEKALTFAEGVACNN